MPVLRPGILTLDLLRGRLNGMGCPTWNNEHAEHRLPKLSQETGAAELRYIPDFRE